MSKNFAVYAALERMMIDADMNRHPIGGILRDAMLEIWEMLSDEERELAKTAAFINAQWSSAGAMRLENWHPYML